MRHVLLALVGLALAATPALAEDPVVLKLATVAPPKTPWAALLTEYKTNVEKASGGKIKVKVFLGGNEVVASQIFFPDEITKEVFNEWQPYRQHVTKRTTFNANDPIKQGVYSEVTRQSKAYAAKALLVVASR